MPESMSILELVATAGMVVQIIMGLLALASVVSWMMIFQRWFFLRRVGHEVDQFEDSVWSGIDLTELCRELEDSEDLNGIETVFVAGFQQFLRLSEQAGAGVDSIMQGVQRGIRVALNHEENRLGTHLTFLATVGSTSPYVGLFGTVWGILNSFRSLANMSQATLASVAPGISEALVATAMGLFAAIPAVIAYNRFSAQVEELMKRIEAFSDEVMSILHRAAEERVSKSI